MNAFRSPVMTPRARTARGRSARRLKTGRTLTLESLEGRTLLTAGFTEFSGPFSLPVDLASGPDGNLWVLNRGTNGNSSLVVVGQDQKVKATFAIPTVNASAAALTVGPDGNLWFVEEEGNKVGKATPAGQITEYAIPNSLRDVGFGSGPQAVVAAPLGIVAGPDGALWFTESSSEGIGRITTDGVMTSIRTPGLQPTSIATGPDHAVWFTDTRSQNSVGRVNADGSVSTFPIPSQFAWPTSLTAGPDGALWFVEGFNHAIGRITTAGVVTETPLTADVPSPQRLTFDTGGNLWVTGDGVGLVRITPQGQTQDVGLHAADGGAILAVATGPDGAIWFTDAGRDMIGRVNPDALPDTAKPSTIPVTADPTVPIAAGAVLSGHTAAQTIAATVPPPTVTNGPAVVTAAVASPAWTPDVPGVLAWFQARVFRHAKAHHHHPLATHSHGRSHPRGLGLFHLALRGHAARHPS